MLRPTSEAICVVPMKRRDIAWIARVTPRAVRSVLQQFPGKVYLAGGFVRSIIANEKVNDVDLFTGPEDRTRAEAAITLALGVKPVCSTKNAVTWRAHPYDIQLITRWTFETPEACVMSFDFTIAQGLVYFPAVAGESDEARNFRAKAQGYGLAGLVGSEFYSDLAAKRLVYTAPARDEDAGGSFLRLQKFVSRGYRAPVDSLADVSARLFKGLGLRANVDLQNEVAVSRAVERMLRLVDPGIDPAHDAHLPSARAPEEPAEGA